MPTVATACSGEGEPLRFSACQYKPQWLLYRDADWRGARPEEVRDKVRALMVAAARAAGPDGRFLCLASVYLPCGATAADLQDFHDLPRWEGAWVVA
eukprot:15381948-Alexandrium_andersonii.AAC.1